MTEVRLFSNDAVVAAVSSDQAGHINTITGRIAIIHKSAGRLACSGLQFVLGRMGGDLSGLVHWLRGGSR